MISLEERIYARLLREAHDPVVRPPGAPRKLDSSADLQRETFFVDEVEYRITAYGARPKGAKLFDLSFERKIPGRKNERGWGEEWVSTATNDNDIGHTFAVLETIQDWFTGFVGKNKNSRGNAFVIAFDSSEGSRKSLYRRAAHDIASQFGMEVMEVGGSDATGVSRDAYLVYDLKRLQEFPKEISKEKGERPNERTMLNDLLKKWFGVEI